MKSSLKKELRKSRYIVQPVFGDSMMPMLDEKTDAVRLVKPPKKLDIGDLPLYRGAQGKYILHRVVSIKKSHYITKGDNRSLTEKVSKRKIAAVADGYFKNGQFISFNNPEYEEYRKKVLSPDYLYISPELIYTAKLYISAINDNSPPKPPAGIDWNKIITVCKRQKITSAVYFSVSKIQTLSENIISEFRKSYEKNLKKDILFQVERDAVFKEFNKENIPYMPLKGILINSLYPHRGMREFADNDILFHNEHQSRIRRIFESRGYKLELSSEVHDVYTKPPFFNFEMHRSLFASSSSYGTYFDAIWRRAETPPDTCKYLADSNDFYIYLTAHFSKHCNGGGCGIRFCGDLYLLQKHLSEKSDFDMQYIQTELKKLSLTDFEKDTSEFISHIFSGDFSDKRKLKEFMSGDAYGNFERFVFNQIKAQGKARFILKKIFMPYAQMKKSYPLLAVIPILLPFYWIVRLFSCIIDKKRRSGVITQLKLIKQVKTKKT